MEKAVSVLGISHVPDSMMLYRHNRGTDCLLGCDTVKVGEHNSATIQPGAIDNTAHYVCSTPGM